MIVKDEKLHNAIMCSFGDKEIFKILDSIMILPKSMADISKETYLPQTNVFRKIKWMLENRLVLIENITTTHEGRKINLFRSTWKSIGAKFELGQVYVEVEQNGDQYESISKKPFSIEIAYDENEHTQKLA